MKSSLLALASILCITGLLAAQTARDTVEFKLFKRSEPTKVGDISLILKGLDVNKQRFNIELIFADGHKMEKKDQDIKIPLLFYAKAEDTQPHELVVTHVGQDQIEGRLMSPLH